MSLKSVNAFVLAASMVLSIGASLKASAEDSKPVGEVKEAGRDVKKSAKKAGRDASDATCEMVNGKMECAGKKMKHKMQNAGDEAKDKMNEPKK